MLFSSFIIPLVYHNSIAINYERDISERWVLGFTLYGQAGLLGFQEEPGYYYREFEYYPHTLAGLMVDYKYKTKLSSSYFKPSITTYSLIMNQTYSYYGVLDEVLKNKGIAFGQGVMIGTKIFYSRKKSKYIQLGVGAAIAFRKEYYAEYPVYGDNSSAVTIIAVNWYNGLDRLDWAVFCLPRINFTFGRKFRVHDADEW